MSETSLDYLTNDSTDLYAIYRNEDLTLSEFRNLLNTESSEKWLLIEFASRVHSNCTVSLLKYLEADRFRIVEAALLDNASKGVLERNNITTEELKNAFSRCIQGIGIINNKRNLYMYNLSGVLDDEVIEAIKNPNVERWIKLNLLSGYIPDSKRSEELIRACSEANILPPDLDESQSISYVEGIGIYYRPFLKRLHISDKVKAVIRDKLLQYHSEEVLNGYLHLFDNDPSFETELFLKQWEEREDQG